MLLQQYETKYYGRNDFGKGRGKNMEKIGGIIFEILLNM